jgi:hypothetical protein
VGGDDAGIAGVELNRLIEAVGLAPALGLEVGDGIAQRVSVGIIEYHVDRIGVAGNASVHRCVRLESSQRAAPACALSVPAERKDDKSTPARPS